jgi:hypothetical protein
LPAANETDRVTPTPLQEVAATRIVEPAPTQPDPNPEPVKSAAGEILFSDTFEGMAAAKNWDLWQDESAEFGIGNGHIIAMGFDEDMMNWGKQVDSYNRS